MRVNLINSFYTSVFKKKQMLKKLTHWKKKEKREEQCNSHCSHAPLFSEQWRHDTLFNEQCIMLHCLNSVAWLFSKSRAKKQHFSAFKLPAFRTQFIVGPIHSEQLFFLNQTLSQCVFEETQPLPRCQTGSILRSSPAVLPASSHVEGELSIVHLSGQWRVPPLFTWTVEIRPGPKL
jgi:hypothetical protein